MRLHKSRARITIMPRTMSPAMLAAAAASDQKVSLFVQLTFRTETARLWSGMGDATWNGETWHGVGSLLGLTATEEAATVEARGITIHLSGLDPALLGESMDDFQLGLPVTVYLVLWSGGSVIADPLVVWSGRTDQPVVDVHPETVTVSLACESRLTDMNVAVDRRLTNQDQQMTWPGDLGLQFVDAIQEMTLFWGFPTGATNI